MIKICNSTTKEALETKKRSNGIDAATTNHSLQISRQRGRVLRRRARDQHGLVSKPTRAILLCP